MARFMQRKDGNLLNLLLLQFIKIDPNDNTNLLIYGINGQIMEEKYDTANEALEAYTTYKTAMTETQGPKQKELLKRIKELSDTIVEQESEISNLEIENETLSETVNEQDDIISRATELSGDVLS